MTEVCTKPLSIEEKERISVSIEIKKVLDRLLESGDFFNLSDNSTLTPVISSDVTRVFSETFSGPIAFRNLILSSLITIDKVSPPCSVLYLDCLRRELSQEDNAPFPVKPFRASSKEVLRIGNKSQITGLGYVSDKAIVEAIKEAGAIGTVKLECSESSSKTLSSGCEFSVDFPDGFYCNLKSIFLKNAKVALYEGSVSEISQIHHILEAASQLPGGLVMLSTGFSKEVSYTLAKNLELKKLKVIPIVVPDEIESINDFHDLCFLLSCMPIGPSNGSRLNTVSVFDLPTAEEVEIFFPSKKLRLKSSKDRAFKLKKMIGRQLAEEDVDDKKDVLLSRINRIMNNTVHLRLKADKCLEGIIQDRVSFFISNISAIAREGAVKSSSIISKRYRSLIPQYMPYFSANGSVKKALSDSNFIFNTGMIIAVDNG